MARMREIGVSFDKGYRDDLNYNFGLLEALIGEAKGLTDTLRQEMLDQINNLQQQINLLTGENIGELMARLNDSIQQALTAAQDARTAKTATEEATALATTATELANAGALLAEEKANYANEKAVLAQEAADKATQEASNLSQLKVDVVQATQDANGEAKNANEKANLANNAADRANQAADNADIATNRAIIAAEAIEGWGTAEQWENDKQYIENNIVTDNGSTWQALRPNINVVPSDGADWICLARKGIDGSGAVSSVNNRYPGIDGNVEVKWGDIPEKPQTFTPSPHFHEISDINDLQQKLNDKATNTQVASIKQIGFYDHLVKELIERVRNPFKRSNIKLLGDSITAGMGGTGYDPSGEPIGSTGFKTNIPTATCWANLLKSYVENKYAKDILIPMNNKNINYSVSYSNGFEVYQNSIVGTQFIFRNADTPSASFTFYGERFSIYYAKIPAGGNLDVYLDGIKIGEISGQGDLSSKNEKAFQNLTNQKHVVELRGNTTGSVVFIEAILIPNQTRVKNWGISGKDSKYIYQNIDSLLEVDDDIIIVQLGTNDRVNTLNTATLKTFQQGIIDKCIALNKSIILMSANVVSAANDNEITKNYKMSDVDEAIFDLTTQNSLKFVSNFSAFEKYAIQNNVTIDSLLDDGLHPNDEGYYVMFKNIVNELGL
ncbi:GDSL-type esterase/lipase family protein [Lysinibacillus irui]|uniref:GDSL-type esterase/lipase family protein n=1 Tax=Lysinibacillus irui TaxID=2998077 RepID=UPI002AD555E6|nr:GDSL-type esterase/lipase family protein [Lysinibacillus irui]MEA0563268.1 GDSL-type esterase/lipase family protein [Lysinibacillus irui]